MPHFLRKYQISTLIFDMDGVITDTMPYHFRAWKSVFACEGIRANYEDIYKREGQKGIDSVREIFKEKDRIYSEHIGHKLLKKKEKLFKTIFKRKFIPGSRLFIKKCHAKGFKLALVTGTSRHEAQKLLPKGLWDCFDVTVCGCDVQNGKPHPEPYLKALTKLKIKAQEALVFENAPFGIRSAKAAGIACVALETSLPSSYLQYADAVFASFKEIETKGPVYFIPSQGAFFSDEEISMMNILLLYKNSTYAGYFLSDRRRLAQLEGLLNHEEIKRFRRTHENHFWSLSYVDAVLKNRKLKYTKACRGSSLDYSRYDLIITVGGDGTFLEAARHVKNGIVWGVNSDPSWSVGRFCSGNPKNFEMLLDKVMAGHAKVRKFNRLGLSFSDGSQPMTVLNDILICHHNPGAMSRYYLTVGRVREEQRSSGVWIATAAGSSGGLHSAGGKVLPQESKDFQYRPRELYRGRKIRYHLKGGMLKPTHKMTLTSLMREGVVFVDGSHVCLPFSFGSKIFVCRSSNPLKIIFE